MKITNERTNRYGKRVVTVELESGEHLMAFKEGSHYRIGYPLEDVVDGRHITESHPVSWCVIDQKWVAP